MKANVAKPITAAEAALLEAVGAYLNDVGWTALVASVDRIQQPIPNLQNYELVIKFTGGQKQSGQAK